ncbi:MAG: S66 peptidase family protein [Myxococcota bacterium]
MMGDDALLVAPSGPLHPTTLDEGLALLRGMEISVAWPDGWRDRLLARAGHLAGSDAHRAEALADAVAARPRAVWMARGGYGSIRTLARGPTPFGGSPVPLWAFSDGTALLAAWDRRGWPAWHAPPVTQLSRLTESSLARVRAAWHAGHVAPFEGLRTLSPGRAEGPLAGGNLCVLASLVGTPWEADLTDRVVLLEDTGEPAYKIDRLVTQILLSGALDRARGLVLGEFTAVDDEQREGIARFFDDLAADLDIPVAAGLPVGHDVHNAPLPFGRGAGLRAVLDCPSGGPASLRFTP